MELSVDLGPGLQVVVEEGLWVLISQVVQIC